MNALGNMRPVMTVDYRPHTRGVDAVVFGDRRILLSRSRPSPYGDDIFGCELGLAGGLAPRLPSAPTSSAVAQIISLGTGDEVGRISATRVVAPVSDNKIWFECAIEDEAGKPMGQGPGCLPAPCGVDDSISLAVLGSNPPPAFINAAPNDVSFETGQEREYLLAIEAIHVNKVSA